MTVSKPVRLLIFAVVLLSLLRARLTAANHTKAVELSNGVQHVLTTSVLSQIDKLLVDLQWGKMLQDVDTFFVNSQFAKVPNLFSVKTPVLIERAADAAESQYERYTQRAHLAQQHILVDKLPMISQLTINNLRVDISQYTSDVALLATFEKNMELVAGSISETTQKVVKENTTARLARLNYIFEQVLRWKSLTYERFLYQALRIRAEMNPGSQLETWVRLETQEIVVQKHLTPYIQTQLFEQYVGESDAFIQLLDDKYEGESDVYADLEEFFTRRASNVTSILKSQYSRVYGIRLQTIDSDDLLDDTQKRTLKVYAKSVREESEASDFVQSSSIGEIRSLYREYGGSLLKQVRVVILAAFLEYEAVSFRAMAEGRQTCIIQFFEMRRALDEAFLFEYTKDRNFDPDLTRTDFLSDFELSMEKAGESMLSLTRTGRILYMYDDARTFVISKANLFFRDDDLILAAVKPLLSDLHDDYASIVPLRLQQGIDDELTPETEIARTYVSSILNSFAVTMEFSFVAELINSAKESILSDVVGKVTYLQEEEFASLSTRLITESLNPFDFAWFQAQSEQFITEDKIRYIDMKQHVVDETNRHASVVLENTRSAYTAQIASLFSKVDTFVGEVVTDLDNAIGATTMQGETSVTSLRATLASTENSMASLVRTIRASTMIKLEDTLSSAMQELEEVQGVRLKNFFNTKIQLIKDEFTLTVTGRVVTVYQEHMDDIEQKMLDISTMAREIYREHLDELLEIERSHRLEVEEVVAPVLDEAAEAILADFNIVSFGARESTEKLKMKNKATAAAREVAAQRRIAIARFDRKWAGARADFSAHFFKVADDSKVSFRQDVIGVVNFAKSLAVDIMGHVTDVIDSLERELFHSLETAFTGVIDSVVGTHDNELPKKLNLESVVYPQGIMGLTEAPVIPALAFLQETEEDGPDTKYDENGAALPAVDQPSGLTTLDIVLALMSWDDWLKGKVDEIVTQVVFEMQDELKQNTCRHNKPPCREGWIQYTNSWEVECCRFDPEEQGFPAWAVTKMLAKEILLALVLDLGTIIETGVSIGKKLGKNKHVLKGAAKGKKLLARGMQKFGGKSGKSMTKAIKLAKMLKGKVMKKMVTKVGTKIGVQVGKVGAKLALAGTKFMAKLSLGPLGIALMIFDVLSLILDLWDPAGYNDAQMAGEIRVERDQIEKYYSEELANDGFDSPLLADPMFNMSPEQQEELQYSATMDWFNGEFAAFNTRMEVPFESMPDSEVVAAEEGEYERLATMLEEDPNLSNTLIAAKMENVFLQDISVRENHRNPFTDGGKDSSRTHTRKNHPSSGIVEIVLNETGVQAFNNFQKKKVAFMNSMKWNPMKRYVKREKDFYTTKDVGIVDIYLQTGQKSKPTFHRVDNPDYNMWNPFSKPWIQEEQYPPIVPAFVKHLNTIAGTKQFVNTLNNFGDLLLKHDIRRMAGEGWTLVDVDPEDEFWVQYDPNKSEADLLDRKKYNDAHDRLAEAARENYELLVHSSISLNLDTISPDGADEVTADHLEVVHLAETPENWSTDAGGKQIIKYPMSDAIDDVEKITYTLETLPSVPAWAGTYSEQREKSERELEAAYAEEDAMQEAALVQVYNENQTKENARLAKRASEENKTADEIAREEVTAGRNADADPPDFAVFLGGYGQSSPLYTIYENCQSMGHGVKYNAQKGLCNFTKEYCKRYGLDFFYNADLGVYDCELSKTQAALEFIFGTTITRSAKRVLGAAPLGTPKAGSCHRALGSTRVCGGVSAKHVQNGETFNYIQPSSALDAIKTLGLSGF